MIQFLVCLGIYGSVGLLCWLNIKYIKKITLCNQEGHQLKSVGKSGHFVACERCDYQDYLVFPIGTQRPGVTPEVALLINHLDEVDPRYLKDMIELYAKHIYEIGYRDAIKEIPHVVETT
jgi:hypothetical protein